MCGIHVYMYVHGKRLRGNNWTIFVSHEFHVAINNNGSKETNEHMKLHMYR